MWAPLKDNVTGIVATVARIIKPKQAVHKNTNIDVFKRKVQMSMYVCEADGAKIKQVVKQNILHNYTITTNFNVTDCGFSFYIIIVT